MTEFELIRRYFERQPIRRGDVALGIGDDAAVLDVAPGRQLVVTCDTLVSGIHFFGDVDPRALGHKALAVNLSDLAAMGAEAAWFTLALTWPAIDEEWLSPFCDGMYELARRFNVSLVGGDTTRGPLALTVTAGGYVPHGEALTRSGARPGDRIYVTGTLGDAAARVQQRQGRGSLPAAIGERMAKKLDWPEPRLREGQSLRGIASAAIDISDGLLADVGHIAQRSGVGAKLFRDQLPLSPEYRSHLGTLGWQAALSGGDDYELCFTVPRRFDAVFENVRCSLPCTTTMVGEIVEGTAVNVFDDQGNPVPVERTGYDHFSTEAGKE